MSELAQQQLTGREGVDNAVLAKEIVDLLKQNANGQTQPGGVPAAGSAPEPISLTLPNQNGELVKYDFENREQLNAALLQVFNNFRGTLAELNGKLAEAGNVGTPVEKGTPGDPSQKVDKQKFLELVGEDPLAGMNYLLGQALFNGQTQDAFDTLRKRLDETHEVKQALALYQFREAFPAVGGPEHGPVIARIAQELGLPMDKPTTFEAALAVARQRGLINLPPPQLPPQPPQQGGFAPNPYQYQVPEGPALPSPFGRSPGPDAQTTQMLQAAEGLTIEQLEKLVYGRRSA